MKVTVRSTLVASLSLACALAVAAPTAGASAPAKQKPVLRILVSNDDGVGADGIDTLVEALRALPRVKVTVVAPDVNKSGAGSNTTPGSLVTAETTTKSGYPAVAVTGFPADAVDTALDSIVKQEPHVVISGINEGQNLGGLVYLSGTVGAARAAVSKGVPALAISSGFGEPPDYAAAAELAVDWVKQHRKELLKAGGGELLAESINVPTCTAGAVRDLVETVASTATEGAVDPSNCDSTLTDPTDDIQAFVNGFATLTPLGTA